MTISLKKAAYCYTPSLFHPILNRIESSPIGARMARGVFWSLLGTVVSRILMLFSIIAVARILGKTVYGELGMIQSTVGMFGAFAGFGLGLTSTKHIAELKYCDPLRAGHILCLSNIVAVLSGGLMAGLLFLFAPWLSTHTINAPHLSGILRLGAIMLFISAANGAQTGALAGFEAYKTIAKINLFVGLISFPTLIVCAYWGGLYGSVWGLVINQFFNLVLNHISIRKESFRHHIPFIFKGCQKELSVLWNFSLPAALSGALAWLFTWLCNAFLVNTAEGYGELGIFNAANQWRVAILFVPGLLSQVALPILSSYSAEESSKEYSKIFRTNVLLNTCISLLVVLPLIFFAKLIMSSYGQSFIQGANVLRIISFSAILSSINVVIGNAISSKGNMWFSFFFSILWGSCLLSLSYFFIKSGLGAIGLAWSTLIAYFLHTIWQSIYIHYLFRCKTKHVDIVNNFIR